MSAAALEGARPAPGTVGPLRFRRLGERTLLTDDRGAHALVTAAELDALLRGEVEAIAGLRDRLLDGAFLGGGVTAGPIAERRRERLRSIGWGPHTHVLSLTRESDGAAMSAELSRRCVDFVFRSTSPRLRLVLRGRGALRARDALEAAIAKARELDLEVKKGIRVELEGDLEGLDDALVELLERERVDVRVVLSPEALDDPDAGVLAAARRIARARADHQGDAASPWVELAVPARRAFLGREAGLLELCRALGVGRLRLLPPQPRPLGAEDAPTVAEWLASWGAVLDLLVDAGGPGAAPAQTPSERGGVIEQGAALFLTRILTDRDPHDAALRSPATDGTGQLAYAWDGAVLASDEGRALYERGDETFLLGRVGAEAYRDAIGHPIVRSIAVTSVLEGQPLCTDCAYLPYCGQSPVHNHLEHGSIQGRMAESAWCERVMGMQDRLFSDLARPERRSVLEAWAGPKTDARE